MDDTTITEEPKVSINLSVSERIFFLVCIINETIVFYLLMQKKKKKNQFKAKSSEIKPYLLCSGNIKAIHLKTNESRIKWICLQFFN